MKDKTISLTQARDFEATASFDREPIFINGSFSQLTGFL